jgi:hypothetical protein
MDEEERVLDDTFGEDGAWFGDSGNAIYQVAIPQGRQLARWQLTVTEGEAEAVEEPEEGATGDLRFVVHWSYGWFGRVSYHFEVFSEPRPDPSAPTPLSLCSELQAHGGAWLGDHGTDTLQFIVPEGQAFASAHLLVIPNTLPIPLVGNIPRGRAVIAAAPSLGDTGPVNVQVEWSYKFFSDVRYFACILTISAPSGPMDIRAVLGEWQPVTGPSMFVAIHMVLLHTGQVLMFSADHVEQGYIAEINRGKSFLWEPDSDSLQEIELNRNLFCAGHCALGDGRILAAGGQNTFQDLLGYLRLRGNGADRDVHSFDPVAKNWVRHTDMRDPRWYPTCATLSDRRVFIIGGAALGFQSSSNGFKEIFDGRSNTISSRSEVFRDPAYPNFMYPFVHLLPGGLIFIFSNNTAFLYDLPADRIVGSFPATHSGTRTYPGQGCGVPLTIQGTNPEQMMILLLGGSSSQTPGGHTDATASAEKFVFMVNDPGASHWEPIADIPHRRFMSDGVLLPDGTILLVNGAGRGEAGVNSLSRLKTFIYNPQGNFWAEVGPSPRNRAYHATALLLLDGSVLVGGSTGHRFFPGHRVEEFQLDVFKLPYFFKGERPQILEAPDSVGYMERFMVRLTLASQINSVCLLRPGSTTHTNNMDQRRIELAFSPMEGDQIEVAGTDNGTIAPPGFYMLFVITADGIPSPGWFICLEGPGDL